MIRQRKHGVLAAVLLTGLCAMSVPATAQGRGGMTWSGDVDDTTIVSVRGDDVRTNTVHGKDASNVSTQVFGRLPRAPIYVYLRHRDGRGQVRIVQQPNPDNGFTAKIRIHDPQAGRGHYDFGLGWQPLPPPGGFGGGGYRDGEDRRGF